MQELVNLFPPIQSQLSITCECFKNEINKRIEGETWKQEIIKQPQQIKQDRDFLRKKLPSSFDKSDKPYTRSIPKRIETP